MTQMAIDGHKQRSTLAYVTPGQAVAQVVRCFTRREEFERVLSGLPQPWVVCVESSRQSPPIVRWLQELGAEQVRLVDARKLHLHTAGDPKTDARDARKMLELQVENRLPECYLACHHVQEWRALTRTRSALRKLSTQVRNCLRALLTQLGLEVGYRDLDGVGAREQLQALAAQLGPLQQLSLLILIQILAALEAALAELDAAIRGEVAQAPVVQALTELPGIGPVLALSLAAEIGEIERFEDPAHLISYAGVAPRANDSDTFHGQRHLPKKCNKRLRHLSVQAAQCASRSREPSNARRAYARVVERRPPNVAKFAAARALLKDVFYRWQQAVAAPSTAA